MPAYDSPAAGWLLPVVPQQARTERDGVVVGGAVYADPVFRCEPGERLSYRWRSSIAFSAMTTGHCSGCRRKVAH